MKNCFESIMEILSVFRPKMSKTLKNLNYKRFNRFTLENSWVSVFFEDFSLEINLDHGRFLGTLILCGVPIWLMGWSITPLLSGPVAYARLHSVLSIELIA